MNNFVLLVISLLYANLLTGQILVDQEPLHHVIYEDEEMRILEIIAIPGDTSLMHQHDYNYCYIARQGGKLWLEDLGQDSREVNLPTHYVGGKFELLKGPFVHRFANIDTTNISFFTIEHKSGIPTRKLASVLPDDVILESDLFTVRKIKIAALSSPILPHLGTAVLLNLSSSPLLFSGEEAIPYWKRFGAKDTLQISNMEKTSVSIAVFEIY